MRYRVRMKSRPGPYEQYDGHIDVDADTEAHACQAAYLRLKNTTFPDRDASMWVCVKVESIEEVVQ